MAQHISIRVPWHDNESNGCVCNAPSYNNACLRLKNIYENRNDSIEDSLCCQCMKGHEMELPCISEGSAFLSPIDLKKTVIHPYKKINQDTHGHFLETEVTFPAYSLPARPYRWLMRDRIADNVGGKSYLRSAIHYLNFLIINQSSLCIIQRRCQGKGSNQL